LAISGNTSAVLARFSIKKRRFIFRAGISALAPPHAAQWDSQKNEKPLDLDGTARCARLESRLMIEPNHPPLRIDLLITSLIAGMGLVLSIFNTIQAYRDRHPKLRVRLSFGFLTYDSPPRLSDQKFIINADNPSPRNVTLVALSIPLPKKRSLALIHLDGQRQMPVDLGPGSSAQFWIDSDELESQTIKAGMKQHGKFRVIARDALGNEHRSSKKSLK
jgi:hypothetical protein